MEYFFQTERLAAGYNGKPVVTGVDVKLKKGQILAIIGPNGSGKSTVLKTIIKQLKTVGGGIRIGGEAIENMRERALSQKAAAVLTERPKPELMTCEDAVAVGRYPHTGMLGSLSSGDRLKIYEALKIVNALDIKDRFLSRVSDGQFQRVMLARAICQEPEIIVLDEPTSFLDIRCAIEILDVLKRMAKERGVTVVMSLHELIFAKRVSDVVMCVKSGRVLYLDTPEKIFTESVINDLYDLPQGAYAQLFGGL